MHVGWPMKAAEKDAILGVILFPVLIAVVNWSNVH